MTRNKKPDPAPTKRQVEVEVGCDSDRILGEKIPAVIEYLLEMQKTLPADAHFCEIRDGYEDWHFAFVYDREETDQEFADRLALERAAAERQRQADDRERQRKQELKQLEKLAAKLGKRVI